MPKRSRDDSSDEPENDIDRRELLRQAILEGDYERIQSLLQRGDIDINSRFKCGLTPYRLAVHYQLFEIILLLIDHGAIIQHCDDEHFNGMRLQRFAREGNHAQAKGLLVIFGANVNCKNDNGWTALHCASYHGHVGIVRLLMNHGAHIHINAKIARGGPSGWTPLHCAVWEGYVEIVRLLVERGANIHAENKNQITPLQLACQNDNYEIARYLFENGGGFDYGQEDPRGPPIHWALEFRSLEILKFFIANNGDINARSKLGDTPLHRAVWMWRHQLGSEEIIKLLIQSGANLNAKNSTGRTPLHRACDICHLEAVRLLVENGANPNIRDRFGKTPLHRVCEDGHVEDSSLVDEGRVEEIAMLLIENGANVTAKDKNGDTPLHLACRVYGRSKMIPKLLFENNAGINGKNKGEKTALFLACEKGNLDAVKLLLHRGADASLKTANSRTPLDIACSKDHLEIVWSLVRQNPWLISE